MNRLNLTIFILSIFVIVSCGTYIPISEQTDEFSGTRALLMDGNELKGNVSTGMKVGQFLFDSDERNMELNLQYFKESASDDGQYYIVAEMSVENDVFRIGSGESLVLLIDGETTNLTTEGQAGIGTTDISSNFETEISGKARYEVSKKDIEKVVNAREVKARLFGFSSTSSKADKPVIEGVFSEDGINAYSKFLKQSENF